MIRFLLYKVLPALTLGGFVLLMNGGDFFKRPTRPAEDVARHFPPLQAEIQFRRWTEASADLAKLKAAWGKLVPRIQFFMERDQMNNFQHSYARLSGYIEAHEPAGALAELNELKETWDDLGE